MELEHRVTYPDGTEGTERVTYLEPSDTESIVWVRLHRNGKRIRVYRSNLERQH